MTRYLNKIYQFRKHGTPALLKNTNVSTIFLRTLIKNWQTLSLLMMSFENHWVKAIVPLLGSHFRVQTENCYNMSIFKKRGLFLFTLSKNCLFNCCSYRNMTKEIHARNRATFLVDLSNRLLRPITFEVLRIF